jgi:hypothetical protein
MDISKMTVTELKATAFDILTNIELLNRDLRTVQVALENKLKEKPNDLEGQTT